MVIPISEKQFRIEYYLKNGTQIESQWNTTAVQLCPGGFQVVYNKRHMLNFDMYVPISGNNVNLGRQEFIQYGQVICNGNASNLVAFTDSKWKEFNTETKLVTPVSDLWITATLKMYVGHLSELPFSNSTAALEKVWGKPLKQAHRGPDRVSTWMKSGDSWFQNYIGIIERNDCLNLVMVLPGISALTMVINSVPGEIESVEKMLTTGAGPAYFYTNHCERLN